MARGAALITEDVAGRRYVVLGAGAVGAALGGLLQAAGARVVLVARGAHLEALRARGLSLGLPSRERRLRVDAVGSVAEARPTAADVVLLCTKSQDSAAALEQLALAAPRGVPVVCAQNGVANEPLAAARFERVYGAVVFTPAELVHPGRVTVHSEPVPAGLDLGRYPAGVDETATAVAGDLVAAGVDARVDPDVMRLKWGKLLTNLGNAVQALVGHAEGGAALAASLREEALACLRAAGIEFAPVEELLERFREVRDLPVGGAPRGGGSTWQSLARGAGSIETDLLNGEVARLGERHGVPAPRNRAITRLALRAAAGGWPPGRMTVAELARALTTA